MQQPDITIVTRDKKRHIALLLLADEQESMIDRYLERGDLHVMTDDGGTAIAVAVVTDEGNGICELKNLAVAPDHQRKGIGRLMLRHLCRHYAATHHTMNVGTGDSGGTATFYKKCGFTYSHRVDDFFTNNYDHPIVEDGKQLKDMLYFTKRL